MSRFWIAIATLIGTIIGAGIIGIPYAVAGPGVLAGVFYLLVLGGIMIVFHLIFGEIVLRTKEKHRLVGYAYKYLGKKGRFLAIIIDLIGIYGSVLIYIILGGELLAVIFSGSAFFWSLATFIIGAVMILAGKRWIGKMEFFITGILVLMIITFFFIGINKLSLENLNYISANRFFLPFGVILYSLMGFAAIPETREILEKDEKRYKAVIIIGTLIPIILYLLFFITIVGVSGTGTSEEVFKGIEPYFGKSIIIFGALFGFLSIITSFFILGLYLKNTFYYDFKLSRFTAWLLVVGVPFLIFIFGAWNFIKVLAWTGSVLAGLGGLLLIKIWLAAKKNGDRKPEYSLRLPKAIVWLLGIIVAGGAVYQILS